MHFQALDFIQFLTNATEFVVFLAVLQHSVLSFGLMSSHETHKVTSDVYKRHLHART